MRKYILIALLVAQGLNVLAQNWLPTGHGTNNGYNGGITLQTFNGKLIAGGAFTAAGMVQAHGVAMWDGVNWNIVDSSMNNFFAVRPLIIFQGQLFGFVNYNNSNPNYIIKLDSSFKWHIVRDTNFIIQTYNGYIYSACVYNNELYVGGKFDTIGNISAEHIAKWDGSTWMPVGTGINNEYVTNLMVYNNELYAGGAFTNAGGVPVNNLAKWNNSIWSDVGGGISGANGGAISTMEIYNGELYIAGGLDHAGGQPMVYITKWNGSTFSDVGGGLGFAGGSPDALKVYGNKLVLGGYFGTGLFQNQAGSWDGANYESLGTGLNAGPTDFEIYNCQLFAGGRFNGIGLANGVAVLDTVECLVSVNEINLFDSYISIYPNPFSYQTTIFFTQEQKNTTIRIIDVLGIQKRILNFNGRQIQIEKAEMPAGIYFIQATDTMKNISIKKIIIN
jgi:trimeric autotransporter adhesin